MEESIVQFHVYTQEHALDTFLPILRRHLPYSSPLFGRIQAPHNLPSRHCLFASTIAPRSSSIPDVYTIIFSDRSRHLESQIWTFNPLITLPRPLSLERHKLLASHIKAEISFLKNTEIPEAPGWPFQPLLRFAVLHETITEVLFETAEPSKAIKYYTKWNTWVAKTSASSEITKKRRTLPDGFKFGRVSSDQLDIVMSTSTIPRQASTLLLLPSIGLLDEHEQLAAWGYIGIDGSFATLYVMPEHRGKGFASFVAAELLSTLGNGGFGDLGYDGKSGYVLSDVHSGNVGSEGVMKSIGAKTLWESTYAHLDSEAF